MVICAVVNCNNNPENTAGVSFHRFPNVKKRKDLYLKWIYQVNRVNPSTNTTLDKLWTPNYHSVVCSDHFTSDCFTKNLSVVESMNLTGFKIRLKPDAYPTLLLGPQQPQVVIPSIKPAFKKREAQRVISEAYNDYMCHQREALNTPPPEPDSDDEILEENNEHDEAPTVGEKRDACMQTEIKKVYVKRIQTEELDLKPIQRTIGTMTDFCQTPVLKSTATMTEDVVQKSVGTETDAAVLPLQCNSEDQQDTDSEDSSDEEDEDWLPDDESDDDYDEAIDELDITDHQEDRAHRERKYIVYESCLKELLSPCRSCQEHCRVVIKSRLGSFVRLLSSCAACGFVFTWGSQPLTSRLPSGNLEVAGSILFSGASVSKALQLFNNMNIMCISERTFRNIQSSYLIPAVRNIWIEYQTAALQQCVARDVKVGGDARCCSPGHSAKYGSYSIMDLESGLILAVELVQVTETENSYRMEMEGLKRCLQSLKERNVRITDLTTDRHIQVKSYMAKEETSIRHWFDVWHVAKGIFKKLQLLAKKKGCEKIKDWCHSISNHLYWSAATSDGDGDLVEEKWLSILNHVCDIHEGHGDRFQACEHPPLADRSWITKGSKADKELQLIVGNKRLVKDVRKLSPAQQTSQLEAYHKTVCHFAPKFHHFFYDAMKARILLAAIHQNENTQRRQAVTKGGELRWKVAYPKAKKGDHTLKAVMDTCSYEYVERLMEEAFNLRRRHPSYEVAQETFRQECPPPMAAFGNRVDKGEAVRRYRTRFNR